MSMDDAYKHLHEQADRLHYSVKDATDDHDHPNSRELHDELRHLIDDFEQQKKPRSIEVRIKDILLLLEPARDGSQPFISIRDAVSFHDEFESMRRDIRELPNY